jgi:6-phosphogluconate dehydrogenase
MQLGFVGLGRMGLNMTARLARHGHQVTAFDLNADAVAAAARSGVQGVTSLDAFASTLAAPRAVWIMVPAGAATESTVAALATRLSPDDVIIDGGNTYYRDDVRRAEELRAKGIHYVDAGTSGGIWGLEEGYCLMVGGDEEICRRLEPVFHALAPPGGYLRTGPHGAGHFVKMIHNGIEYGLMQAYAEGFDLLQASDYELDLAKVAQLWMRGSVVRSWLLELAGRALAEDPRLEGVEAFVADSGEGRWTLQEAIERGLPAPALTSALFTRFRSREANPFAERLLAALRQQFGGHAVKRRAPTLES